MDTPSPSNLGGTQFTANFGDGTPSPIGWRSMLLNWLRKEGLKVKNQPRPVTALKPGLILKFIQGPQLTTEWQMGYGPRQVGAKSVEFPIFEEGAPDFCFEVIPTPKGIRFKTTAPEVVMVNDLPMAQQLIKAGDIISIHKTRIEVGFKK